MLVVINTNTALGAGISFMDAGIQRALHRQKTKSSDE